MVRLGTDRERQTHRLTEAEVQRLQLTDPAGVSVSVSVCVSDSVLPTVLLIQVTAFFNFFPDSTA